MSIPVELDELRAKIADFTTEPFLLTVSDDLRAHSVAVAVRWDGDELVVAVGRTSLANAEARPLVALLWPAPAPGEFSLIVDAETTRAVPAEISCRPTRAVLHRPAPSGTGSDCQPVL
jgi:hypothetical protein